MRSDSSRPTPSTTTNAAWPINSLATRSERPNRSPRRSSSTTSTRALIVIWATFRVASAITSLQASTTKKPKSSRRQRRRSNNNPPPLIGRGKGRVLLRIGNSLIVRNNRETMARWCLLLSVVLACCFACGAVAQRTPTFIEVPADVLEDKIRGGMLAQVIGNLNGLPHEFKYIAEPGNVERYTPSLPKGAFTDDDTDIEWIYIHEIARTGTNNLSPEQIARLWKQHINRRIFCANRYARDLMDLGIEPPWTSNVGLNPWSEFNISGQFMCESFGLMAPAMPQTAARVG